MALNAWTNLLGVTQGRITPTNYTPTQGSSAFALGSDVSGVFRRLQHGDLVEVKQTNELEEALTLRFNARTRGPAQLPTVINVTAAAAGTYTITVNGTAFTFVAVGTDTTVSIAKALVTRINFATVTGITTETFALVTGQAITFDVEDDARNVTFLTADFSDIANATAAEVVAVIERLAPGVTASVASGAVVITSDLQGVGSKLDNFAGTALAALGFTSASDERLVPVKARMAGNGDAVQLDADDPDVAFTTAVVGSLAIGTFLWKAKMLIGGVPYFEQTVRPGRTRNRLDGGAMVRNFAVAGGTHEVIYRLELECTITSLAAELELPAFYVDNMTLELGFQPTDLVNCAIWLRADKGIELNGANVIAWANSGTATGLSWDQSTPTDQPLFVASDALLSNKPSVDFDGANHYLFEDDMSAISAAWTDVTFFYVIDPDSLSDNDRFMQGGPANAQYIWMQGNSSTLAYFDGTATRSSAEATTLNAQYLTLALDATNLSGQFSRDGVDVGGLLTYDGTWDWSSGDDVSLGAAVGGSLHSNVRIAEVIIYPRLLSLSEKIQVWTYLAARYGI